MKAVFTLFILQFSCYLAIGQSYIITPDSLSYKRNNGNGLNSLHLKNGSSLTKRLTLSNFFMESNTHNFLQISGEGESFSGLLFKSSRHSENQAAFLGLDARNKRITFSHNFNVDGTPPFVGISFNVSMVIDSLGRVGIGTFFPKSRLYVSSGNSSGVTPNGNSLFVIDRSTSSYINLLVPDDDESGILFGRPTGGAASGGIIYDATRALNFRTSSNDTRMTITEAGSVGIGTTIPEAKLHVDGDFVISKRTFLPNTTQIINDLDRLSASIISSAASATAYITTISGIAGGVDGLILYINPVQNATIILLQENTGSTDINRIITHTNAGFSIANNGGVTLMYDAIVERWRVISVAN